MSLTSRTVSRENGNFGVAFNANSTRSAALASCSYNDARSNLNLACSNTVLAYHTQSARLVQQQHQTFPLEHFPSYLEHRELLQNTCRTAAPDLRHGLEVQRTSVQKQTHLLCPFTFQLGLETINCPCHHRIIIQHIPLGHHSMREEIFSNIPVAPTFNQLQ